MDVLGFDGSALELVADPDPRRQTCTRCKREFRWLAIGNYYPTGRPVPDRWSFVCYACLRDDED